MRTLSSSRNLAEERKPSYLKKNPLSSIYHITFGRNSSMPAPLEVWIAKMPNWKQNTYPAISLTSFATPLASLQKKIAIWWWLYSFWKKKMFCCFLYWIQFTGWLDSDARPAVDVVHGEHVVHAPARDQIAAWREGRGHYPRRLQGDHLCHEAWSPPFLKHMTTNLLSTCILLPVQESQTINFPSRDPLTCSWWSRLRCHTFLPCHNNSHIFVQSLRSQ